MTEAEWLACGDPHVMLNSLNGNASCRKVRLFACACCRHIWGYLSDRRSRSAVAALEEDVDRSDSQLLRSAEASLRAAKGASRSTASARRTDSDLSLAARHAAWAVLLAADDVTVLPAQTALAKAILKAGRVVEEKEGHCGGPPASEPDDEELSAQGHLLRDIFGNPFRPVTFASSWRTNTAVMLARQMYESQDFSAMPILADALQDAGCDSADVLDHCRGPGPHVRGCWVLDQVFGNE